MFKLNKQNYIQMFRSHRSRSEPRVSERRNLFGIRNGHRWCADIVGPIVYACQGNARRVGSVPDLCVLVGEIEKVFMQD